MQVNDEIRKCVAFIGMRMADGSVPLVGSVFFLGAGTRADDSTRSEFAFAVTARHVIDGIRGKGIETPLFRMNLKAGGTTLVPIPFDRWFFHPTRSDIDVAIAAITLSDIYDHLLFPHETRATVDYMRTAGLGLGDEVVVTGLFRPHSGSAKNIPIVRVGNFASLGEELIQTKMGPMELMLIEARSTGGLSGSPVFLSTPPTRIKADGSIEIRPGPLTPIVGMIHGHFDEQPITALPGQEAEEARVNMGIAMVVPMHSIDLVLEELLPRVHALVASGTGAADRAAE